MKGGGTCMREGRCEGGGREKGEGGEGSERRRKGK